MLSFVSCERNNHFENNLLIYIDATGTRKIVQSEGVWERKRNQILDSLQRAMGELPDTSELPPMNIQYRDRLKEDTYIRYTISFTPAPNEEVTAYLYTPIKKGLQGKNPAIIVLHGTGDLGKRLVDGESPLPNRAHAKELAERGYVVIAPDYPSMGEQKDYDFDDDRYESATMKGIFNHMRCVDLLLAREDVDPERIGALGHSLGGHNAMFLGAFDTRLKVIVSSCGWTLFDYDNIEEDSLYTVLYGGRLGDWAQERYMPLLKKNYNLDPKKFPFDFDEVIAAIAPRAFFSNSPKYDSDFNVAGVVKGMKKALELYRFLGAEDKLEVVYPGAQHDFPPEARQKAYQFVDQILEHEAN